MTAEAILFDPEFEAILREAAAEPGSCLLKVPRPKLLKGLFDRSEPISDRASELSKVERHLLQVYRCEMAWLLRQACLIKLIDGPRSRLWVSRYKTADEEYERLKPEQLASRVHAARNDDHRTAEFSPVFGLLFRCTKDPTGDEPTVADLASLSCRLEPTDYARILVAMDLSHRGSPRTAVHLLLNVLERPVSEAVTVSARDTLGVAYAALGDMKSTHRSYTLSCASEHKYINAWMCRLFFGIQLGLRHDVQESSRRLEELLPMTHPALESYIRSLEQQRHEGGWNPTADSQRVLTTLRSSLGLVAGRIADVFT